MNNETINRLKKLDIEEVVWLVLIFIIILSFYANTFERDYLINKNNISKEKYKNLLIIIFSLALITYIYFFIDSINDIKELKDNASKEKIEHTYLSFISSLLIVIAGIILLYIAYNDKEVETELAFN